MAEWKVKGFRITMYNVDHPPRHAHVRKDGENIGKYNLEDGCWMTGPKKHADQAEAAIRKWRHDHGI